MHARPACSNAPRARAVWFPRVGPNDSLGLLFLIYGASRPWAVRRPVLHHPDLSLAIATSILRLRVAPVRVDPAGSCPKNLLGSGVAHPAPRLHTPGCAEADAQAAKTRLRPPGRRPLIRRRPLTCPAHSPSPPATVYACRNSLPLPSASPSATPPTPRGASRSVPVT